jgi:SAM-dependent methyltransferase
MTFGKNYSEIYNFFYKKKNYIKEVKYIISILKRNKNSKLDILELGLGSGNHAKYFIKNNYKVCGVEKSPNMIKYAKKIPKLKCILDDIRSVRINKKFNIAISLFHVINYMLTTLDLNNFFKTANVHLHNNGLLIFDTWHDRAIKTKKHSDYKVFKINNHVITRSSRSKVIKNNIIDIRFKFITTLNKKVISTFSEKHLIRYFSLKEIIYSAQKNGFQLISRYAMLKFLNPLKTDKNICFVFKKLN